MKSLVCFILRVIGCLPILFILMINDFTSFKGFLFVIIVCVAISWACFTVARGIDGRSLRDL